MFNKIKNFMISKSSDINLIEKLYFQMLRLRTVKKFQEDTLKIK